MKYRILLIFAMTAAITLYLVICSSNAFAINEKSSNPLSTTSSFDLTTDNNNSSTIKNNNQNYNQNYNSTANLKNTSQQQQQQQNNLLITKLLAKNLENHIQKAGAILQITSKLPQVREVPFANVLNQTLNTLHGIPQNADIQKRQVAKSITNSNSDLYEVAFFMPNGNMYLTEPYSEQKRSTLNNYAFRDYFQGAIKTNDTYLGNLIISKEVSPTRDAIIAAPVYSIKDTSTTIDGVWAGGLDLNVLNKELQSFNFTTSSKDNNTRVVYVDSVGQKIANSDINKSKMPESFANLQSFKNAINGQSGSIVDTIDNTKMMVTYQPVQLFHNTWAILLMQPLKQ